MKMASSFIKIKISDISVEIFFVTLFLVIKFVLMEKFDISECAHSVLFNFYAIVFLWLKNIGDF